MAIPPNDHAGLRFPEDIQPTLKLSHEDAVRILFRALELAKTTPFVWKYVDKPNDGTGILFFIQNHLPPPLDGIRYLQHEQRFAVPVNNQFELEVHEQGFGYIPGQEQIASRVRRRYRLTRGGHPNLFLYHWTRGPGQNVPQQLLLMPARNYPLPPHNDLPVFVHGDRRGQRVNMAAQGAPIPQPGHPQQVQLSAQNQHMAAHDARHRQAQVVQAAQRAPPPAPVPQPRLEEESDPADDLDHISTRTLASTRYKRNHELINQVFMHAAFGQRETTRRPPAYSSIFDKSKLEEKISSLTSELQDLRAKAAAREVTRDEMKLHEDENMSFEAGPTEVSTNA